MRLSTKKIVLLASVLLVACTNSSSGPAGGSPNPTAEPTVLFGPIAKDSTGELLYVNQVEALSFCVSQGGRLPTIREFANYVTPSGSGIRESKFKSVDIYAMSADQYEQFKAERTLNESEAFMSLMAYDSANKLQLEFYYNQTKFDAPSASFKGHVFWTSSYYFDYYVLDGSTGEIDVGYADDRHEVMCVKDIK